MNGDASHIHLDKALEFQKYIYADRGEAQGLSEKQRQCRFRRPVFSVPDRICAPVLSVLERALLCWITWVH